MVEDTPEDLVHDLLSEAYFGDHPLARPILGTAESIANMTKDIMLRYLERAVCAGKHRVCSSGRH